MYTGHFVITVQVQKEESKAIMTIMIGATVEVGSLHTLRLESLKLVFQPLHKFLVNKL